MEKKNILILSNSPNLYFGYSVVFSKVARALSEEGHNVYYLGMQSFGEPTKYDNYTLLSIKNDPWCSDCLEDYINIYKIDTVLTALDIWMPNMKFIPDLFKRRTDVKWIHHLTANSEPLSPYIINNILPATTIVAPSKYNYGLLKQSGFENIEYVPHFVEPEIFNVNENSREKYRKLLGLEDKFVFVTVMRNRDLHKNPSALFKAYKQFLIENEGAKEKTRLIFVCDPKEQGGMDLISFRKMTGLEGNIIFPSIKIVEGVTTPCLENEPNSIPYSTSIAFSREVMAGIYNASDVHVNTSSGESFGLPILESMACGKPQIVHGATTGLELVAEPKTGFAIKPGYRYTVSTLSDIHLIDIHDLKQAFNKMYVDYEDKSVQDLIINCKGFVKPYDLYHVEKMWVKIFSEKQEEIKELNYNGDELGI